MQSFASMYAPNTMTAQQFQLLTWLSSLQQSYQQPFVLPLLQSQTQQPIFFPREEDFLQNNLINFSQVQQNFQQQAQLQQPIQFINQSPNSCYMQDTLAAESTQENSPKPTFYNVGLGVNDCFSLQDKPLEMSKALFPLEGSFNKPAFSQDMQSSDKKMSVPISKKIKKASIHKIDSAKKNRKTSCDMSAQVSCSINSKGLGDDKNIIHINFTKNLLKSFRRYCEYYHKSNTALLLQIKRDFETNHMNNQLLMHFMTSPGTAEQFQLFVDGPAQKWVKEQSRLKKQDQQLELIEICRQRVFDKIKVKKYYSDAPSTNDQEILASSSPQVSQNVPSTLTAHPIFDSIEKHAAHMHMKSVLTSSSEEGQEIEHPVQKKSPNSKKLNNLSSKKQMHKLKVNPEADCSNSLSSSSSSPSQLSSNPAALEVFEAKFEEAELIKIEDN